MDSTVVRRLREAGAIIIGAPTRLSLPIPASQTNPHYGTPKNVFDRATGRIPGGSTSGGAISGADGMAAQQPSGPIPGLLRIPSGTEWLVVSSQPKAVSRVMVS